MNRKLMTVAVACFVLVTICVPYLSARDEPVTRTLTGQVMKEQSNAPLPGAVVYLKNTRTMTVRSYVSDDHGNYRFTSLSPNIDYEVHAEYKGAKSDTKTLSSFDSRTSARINLRVNTP